MMAAGASLALTAPPAACIAQELLNHQLHIIRPDGTGLRQITNRPELRFGSPTISPSGEAIAADCAPAHLTVQDTHIVVMGLNGDGMLHFEDGAMPAWSPDGKLIAFHTYKPVPAIKVMNWDGTGSEEVARRWGSPRWSPDGQQLIYSHYDGLLRRIDVRTGVESAVTKPTHGAAYAGFGVSQDGRRIAFGDRGQRGLTILDIGDGWQIEKVHRVLQNSSCTFCSFSPDGKRLVFSMATRLAENPQLYVMDVDGTGVAEKLKEQDPKTANVNPHWSPDGEWIIFTSDPAE